MYLCTEGLSHSTYSKKAGVGHERSSPKVAAALLWLLAYAIIVLKSSLNISNDSLYVVLLRAGSEIGPRLNSRPWRNLFSIVGIINYRYDIG